MSKKYIGYIGIIGKPNVGKSSLLNAIFSQKIAIVNKKPQATRQNLKAVFSYNDLNVMFIDTPGFHEEKNKLDKFLNEEVKESLQSLDAIFFLFDSTRPFDDEDQLILEIIFKIKIPVILVITKSDLVSSQIINQITTSLNSNYKFNETVVVSINEKSTISNLLETSKKYLNDSGLEINSVSTLKDDYLIVSELIREQCMNLLEYEIPYGVAVLIDVFNYDKEKKLLTINATINVEKDSHKKIIIGKNARMIKEISMISRHEIEKIFDAKVFLKIFVKVSKNWRNNLTKLKEFGYYH